MASLRLAGKTALITGAASGIGAATARAFVEEGGQVMIADLADAASEALAADLGAAAAWTHLDVTDPEQWRQAVQATVVRFGSFNVLANVAGILEGSPLEELDLGTWERTIAINLTGPMLGMQIALPHLKAARPASIINMSSAAGVFAVSSQHGYTASKFGLTGLTKSVALELSDEGVRVNSVHPGSIRTRMTEAHMAPYAEYLETATDLRVRPGKPEEVAALMVFLASDESSFATGSEFRLDGGLTAGMKF